MTTAHPATARYRAIEQGGPYALIQCPRCSGFVLQTKFGDAKLLVDIDEVDLVTWSTLRANDMLAADLLPRGIMAFDGTQLVSGVPLTAPSPGFALATTRARPAHYSTCPAAPGKRQ